MKVLVVFESYFGNTEQFARAVADGLRRSGAEVLLADVAAGASPGNADLLVLGAPTHSMGLPSASTRRKAESLGGAAHDAGLREWLDAQAPLRGRRIAVFSTVTGGSRLLSGSAAKVLDKTVRRQSATVVARADFRVEATSGPPTDGEIERAAQWGASLA